MSDDNLHGRERVMTISGRVMVLMCRFECVSDDHLHGRGRGRGRVVVLMCDVQV